MQIIRISIKNKAVSQYDNFNIVSMCKVGDKIYGAGPDGLFKLSCEHDDNGTQIDSYVKTFAFKLDHEGLKKCRFIYLNIESDGDIKVIPIVDDIEYNANAVTFSPVIQGKKFMRMPIDRSIVGTYWQFKIENVDGSWFYIDKCDVIPVKLSRGHGW